MLCLGLIFLTIEQELSEQWYTYLENVINPVKQLREDLKYRRQYIVEDLHTHEECNSVAILKEVGII